MSKLIVKLLALGYSKANIVVFFRVGWYSKELSEVSNVMQEKKFDATHLRSASPADLLTVLKVWAFSSGKIQPPKFLFFLAADHGCNNAFMEEEKDGNGEDGMHGGGPAQPVASTRGATAPEAWSHNPQNIRTYLINMNYTE